LPGAGPASPALPAGYTRYSDAQLGFEIGLAAGWTQSNRDPQGGITFSGPGGVTLLVHFEQAPSTRLDAATAALLAELTAGNGVLGAHHSPVQLAGRSAERVDGMFEAPDGQQQAIVVDVMLEGSRVWVLAVVGPPAQVSGSAATFEAMARTFRLVGAGARAPARVAMGQRAPGFRELDQVKGPVIVNFFATWCADCRADMPAIASAAAAHKGRVTLIGVDCCGDDSRAVAGFLKDLAVEAQFRIVAYDDGHLAQLYSLIGPPTTVFLDQSHVLRDMVVGPVTPAELSRGLKAIAASS
jgi:thiol-disulfide isomerase/thioredoxin